MAVPVAAGVALASGVALAVAVAVAFGSALSFLAVGPTGAILRSAVAVIGCGTEATATGGAVAAAAGAAAAFFGSAFATAVFSMPGFVVACWTSTAPAVTIAAAARPAPSLDATVPKPTCSAAPAPAVPAPAAAAPVPEAAAVVPMCVTSSFLNSSSGPIGNRAASALLLLRRYLRKSVQRSQVRRWRRTGAVVRFRPSATSPSSIRTSSHESRRASAASARDTRARTSSDFTDGTVVSIASAICSYDSASISRNSSAVRCVSGGPARPRSGAGTPRACAPCRRS